MAKGKPQAAPVKKSAGERPNGKAVKKSPKIFDAIKRKLVKKKD